MKLHAYAIMQANKVAMQATNLQPLDNLLM